MDYCDAPIFTIILEKIHSKHTDPGKENISIQKWVLAVAILLFFIKLAAYFMTNSVAILTDALEGTVNVAAGLIGLYSLYVSAKPRDIDHPYGHGKAEFLSAGVEGTLIAVAGVIIMVESVRALLYPSELKQLDNGIYMIAFTAIVNYTVGYISINKGKKNNSLALVASGKHLQSDTYSTIGIIIGLILIYITGLAWLDSVVAILFALFIVYTGYKIVRSSIAGIMDEADEEILSKMVELLNTKRRENWIDLHNLRVIKYGGQLHVDAHLTMPWYLNLHEAHKEIDALGEIIRKEFGDSLEMFIHSDGCLYYQCNICAKENCPVRHFDFDYKVDWTMNNVLSNQKHRSIL